MQFLASVLLLTSLVSGAILPTKESKYCPNEQLKYDYVVVGSGIGGGTVAVSLAKKGHSVLLLESGPDYATEKISIPLMNIYASEEPHIHYDYKVKYFNSGVTKDKMYHYPRVGGLGGCSTHNSMLTVLPASSDYDKMIEVTGDKSWNEKSMRKIFQSIEKNYYVSPTDPNYNITHGSGGWFPTSYPDPAKLLGNEYDPQSEEIFPSLFGGLSDVDINGYDKDGKLNIDKEAKVIIPMAVDAITAERVDFRKLIRDTSKNFKLDIWTDTFVTKVLLDSNNTAYGVLYKQGQFLYKASSLYNDTNHLKSKSGFVGARKEIIVAGGAFNTPQILLLSGIGDSNHLKEMNISTKVDLPGVGRNLMDKHQVSLQLEFPKNFKASEPCNYNLDSSDPCYQAYKVNSTGPYTFNGVFNGHFKKSSPNLSDPDYCLLSAGAAFDNYEPGFADRIMNGKNLVSQVIFKSRTKSKGYVKLKSDNPFDTPEINFNKFEDGEGPGSEIQIILDIVKQSREYLKNISKLDTKEKIPGSNLQTDEQLRNYIRENIFGLHICCTAKIGKDDDKYAVLDNKFRVRNTKNLRVVDASAYPQPIGYFPAIFTHMMAIKAADIIADGN